MNLSDLKGTLGNFLSGDLKAETETMLQTMGYGKQETVDVEKIKADAIATVDVEKIKADATEAAKKDAEAIGTDKGIETARNSAVEILDLCSLAGTPGMAAELIKSGETAESAKAKIIKAKADGSMDNDIHTQHSGLNSGGVNPLLASCQKAADDAKKR